jgi:hypothetical protein
MKLTWCTLILIGVTCSTAWSQDLKPAQVPAAVMQGLRARFPSVKTAAWKLKDDKNYEAEFTEKGVEYAVKFDTTGKWLESEYAIPGSAVPRPVLDAVASKFKGYKTTEIQRLQRWNDDRPIYELHVENAKEIVKLQFGEDGAVVSQSSKPQPSKK